MSRLYLLDTNTVSDIVRHRSLAAKERISRRRFDEVICISSITEAELRYGMAKQPTARSLHAAIEALLQLVPVLAWRSDEARVYGDLRARQRAAGRPLAELDLLIASHAVAVGAVLVTRDKAFGHVAGLVGLENWATDL